ncbi:hypothetical protein ABZ951_23220 [Streptomyces sp. NPDC046215]|uniref:Uncharacterized protein n=1 Tax=Streptomyces stramineus TaxID=173861 RepID=A0ABN1AIX1_9ACTN
MVAVALLLPPLLLCAVLALSRYEDRMLGGPAPPRARRLLRAVPPLPDREPGDDPAEDGAAHPRRKHAA